MNGLSRVRVVWRNRSRRFTNESQTRDEILDSVNAVGGGFIPTLLFEGGGADYWEARRRSGVEVGSP